MIRELIDVLLGPFKPPPPCPLERTCRCACGFDAEPCCHHKGVECAWEAMSERGGGSADR